MNSVILEISNICIKTGFAGNSSPANITWLEQELLIPSDLTSIEILDKTRIALRTIIRQVFREKLLVNFKNQQIICIDPNYEFPIRNLLTRLFLHDLRAGSITFLPRSVCTIIGAGVRNGIVIDIGWNSISVTTVGDLREMEQLETVRGVKWMLSSSSNTTVSSIEGPFHSVDTSSLDFKAAFLDEDEQNDIEERSVLQLTRMMLKSLDHATRALVIPSIMFNSTIVKVPKETEIAMAHILKAEDYPKVNFTPSLGSWRGCSLYMSSVPWGAQGLKIPGEIKRDDRKSLAGDLAEMRLEDK